MGLETFNQVFILPLGLFSTNFPPKKQKQISSNDLNLSLFPVQVVDTAAILFSKKNCLKIASIDYCY